MKPSAGKQGPVATAIGADDLLPLLAFTFALYLEAKKVQMAEKKGTYQRKPTREKVSTPRSHDKRW